MATLRAGALLARRYRLIDPIGAGGMSIIWRARDELLDRMVAIKVLTSELAADAKFRDWYARRPAPPPSSSIRTSRRSTTTARWSAPDGIDHRVRGDGAALRRGAGVAADRGPAAVAGGGRGVRAGRRGAGRRAPARHRAPRRHARPTSCSPPTARRCSTSASPRTSARPDEDEEGDTFGTPAYVAPERLDGVPAQPATDTYSLGVLLFETLSGQVPFPAETWDDLARAQPGGPMPPLVVRGPARRRWWRSAGAAYPATRASGPPPTRSARRCASSYSRPIRRPPRCCRRR